MEREIVVRVFDATTFLTTEVRVSPDVLVDDGLRKILENLSKPIGESKSYNLYHQQTRQELDRHSTLEASGISNNSLLVLEGPPQAPGLQGTAGSSPSKIVHVQNERTVFVLRAENGKAFELKNTKTVIGRADPVLGVPDIDLTDIDRNDSASRKHAVVVTDKDGYYLIPMKTTNGTFINGQTNELQPDSRVELKSGDVVEIGHKGVRLTFGKA